MTIIDFIGLLLVAGIVGTIGQWIAGYSMGGCLASIVVGFIGALVGVWLARAFSLPELLTVHVGGTAFPILWSVIGSAIFVFVIGLFTRRWVAV